MKKEPDPPGELVAHRLGLRRTIRASEEDAGLRAGWANHDIPEGAGWRLAPEAKLAIELHWW